MIWLVLLATPVAEAASPKATLTRGVLRIDNGQVADGVADLEGIRGALDDPKITPRDVAKLHAYLAYGHVWLASKGVGDPAQHLDVAFSDWTACVGSTDPKAAPMVKKCRADAEFASKVTLNRAAGIAASLGSAKAAGSPSEARNRCAQLDAYAPDTVVGATCHALIGRALRDPDAAAAAAHNALDRAGRLDRLQPGDADGVDVAVSMGIEALLQVRLDVDEARTLLVRADALRERTGAALPRVEQTRTMVADFGAKMVPARETARSGGTAADWRAWLRLATQVGLHELGAGDATAAIDAYPDDAAVLETAGIVLNNAVAVMPRTGDVDARRQVLTQARDAFARCVEVDAAHPRCAERVASAEASLEALDAE